MTLLMSGRHITVSDIVPGPAQHQHTLEAVRQDLSRCASSRHRSVISALHVFFITDQKLLAMADVEALDTLGASASPTVAAPDAGLATNRSTLLKCSGS